MARRAWWVRASSLAVLVAFGCGGPSTSPSDAGEQCADECNDMNACTVDVCAETGCVHTYDEASCCTADQCEIDGACVDNGEPNPENPCEVCRVVEAADAWSTDGTATCDDGDPCTSDDVCAGATCRGTAYECGDDDPCTDDVCTGDGACEHPENTAPCSDGDACTVGDRCAAGTCTAGESADCDDDNPCTADSCASGSGCENEPLDGVACTLPSSCAPAVCREGACVVDGPDPCDDDDLCTVDACDGGGCVHNDLTSLCVDTNPCTDDGCDPAQGCVFAFNTNGCDDANPCTAMDRCTDGACTGAPVPIDDGNVCTDDACDPVGGITHVPNTLPCDDGNACMLGETCGGGTCAPGTRPVDCDDDNVCTADSCDPSSGCANADRTAAMCDDGNACTADSCDPVSGCGHSVVSSFACRPNIVVTYPPRAATVQGSLASPVVNVTGTVSSAAGAITSFTINGDTVAVNPSTGAFTYPMDVTVGANVFVIEAADALGTTDTIVQSYHWSTAYTRPNPATPGSGAVNPGLGIWLDQDSIDDGRNPPPTDLAAIFRGVLQNFDLSSFFDPTTPIAVQSPFTIYLTSLDSGGATTQLTAIDGGMHVTASILDIEGDLVFDCTGGFLACLAAGGDSTGGMSVDTITINADLLISVRPDHTLAVGSSRVDLQACKLEYSIVSPK